MNLVSAAKADTGNICLFYFKVRLSQQTFVEIFFGYRPPFSLTCEIFMSKMEHRYDLRTRPISHFFSPYGLYFKDNHFSCNQVKALECL